MRSSEYNDEGYFSRALKKSFGDSKILISSLPFNSSTGFPACAHRLERRRHLKAKIYKPWLADRVFLFSATCQLLHGEDFNGKKTFYQ